MHHANIDLRIDKGKIRGLFALSGLRLALEDQLGTKVDLLTSDSLADLRKPFLRPALRDGVESGDATALSCYNFN